MAKGWFRDLLTPMKPTETTSREWVNFLREWVLFFREAFFILLVRLYLFFFIQFDPSESVDFFREAFFIPLLRLYLFFFLLFCLGYFLQFDPCDVVLSGYLCYLVITTLKKLIYLQNAETSSRAFFAPISIHAGILGLLLSLPSPRHYIITSFDPPLFVLDGLLFSYYCLIGLSLLLSVQILKIIMKPMLKTLEISLKNKGIISVSSKFESGKDREQKPLVDFDSTNNRAYQSGLLVPNSDKTTVREASKGPCMTEGALGLVDPTTRISSTDFDAPENGARLVRANQSGPIMLNSEKKDTSERLNRECLSEGVLSLDDSTKRKSFPDFDATENKAHLVRSYQSGPVVSLSENKNKGEALKRECITKSILGVEDLQQHCGGRPDAAAKSFRVARHPDQHREKNTSTACEVPSHNVETGMEIEPVGQNQEANVFRQDFTEGPTASNTENGLMIVWRPPDQLEGQTMQFTAHPNQNAQIALSQVPSANRDRRNSLASQVEAFFMGLVSESSNLAFPEYFDAAAPSQPVAPILKERQDTWSMKVKVTYGDSIIKFLLLLTSGIKELMQEVSLTLDCVLGSFNFDYMDEDDYMDVDEDCFTTPCEFNGPPFTSEILQQYFGHKRKDVAASLGVSVSTFKRKCRQQGIMRWPNGMGNSVSKPPDQHGERNTSTACETPSHYVQTGMEGELFGQNEMANVFPRDFMGGLIALDTESGLIMVSRPPDQHGERNTSTACGTPSRNVETGMEVEPVGQNQEANVFHQDFMYGPIALNTDGLRFPECSDAVAPSQPMATILDTIPHLNGGSSECAFQVKNQSTFTANPYPNGLVDPHPQIALTQILSEDMERLEDRRNLLAPRKEPLPKGHVFGSVNRTVRSCSDVALSQPMPTIPDTTGCSEYWRNSLALLEEHLLEENYGSINLTALSCFDPGPSQPRHTIPHTMPTIPQMMPLLTERQDMSSVRLKATYGNTTIKFPLPSGFSELEEEVSKRLEFERGNFKLEYKDEEGDSVLIACDEDVRDYLRLLTSLGNQVVKLFVLDKVPNTTNFCDNCKSLSCKRP